MRINITYTYVSEKDSSKSSTFYDSTLSSMKGTSIPQVAQQTAHLMHCNQAFSSIASENKGTLRQVVTVLPPFFLTQVSAFFTIF